MQIARVTAYGVSYPEPNDNGNQRSLVFCRIDGLDGTTGWGEAPTMIEEASRATIGLIEQLADIVVGRSVLENLVLWREMKRSMWWHGYEGGLCSFALSAIDIAMWDLKAKVLGVPLVDLLGGAEQPRLTAVASTHAFLPEIRDEAERHGAYVHEMGFAGVKIGLGKRGAARLGVDIARDVAFVRAIREAIGPDALLMIDRGQSLRWDVAAALARARAVEAENLYWIEEPLEPEDEEGFRRLRAKLDCRIATGEREWTERGYERLIKGNYVDVVGCDPGRSEGITGALAVIRLVEAAGLWFNAHAWSGAVITAASIALTATTNRSVIFELKPIPNPMQDELVEMPFAQTEGLIDVPRSPGLGVEVNEKVLFKYQLS